MNKIALVTIGSLLTTLSFTSAAAEKIQHSDSSMQEVAVISAKADSPEALMQKLTEKADAVGATQFKVVTLTSQDDNERGTAIAYR